VRLWPPQFGLGFEIRGTLRGTFFLFSSPEVDRDILLETTLGAAGIRRLALAKTVAICGTVALDTIANRRPFAGEVRFRLDERRIPYDLTFTGDDGTAYALRGQADLWWLGIVDALTLLPASLYDGTGREIGRALLRFDAKRELFSLVRSFRLTRGALPPGAENGTASSTGKRDIA